MIEGFPHIQLNHALMEFEYSSNYSVTDATVHESTAGLSVTSDAAEVAMTLTSSQSGHLLLGIHLPNLYSMLDDVTRVVL